jgi:GGDEF domain-containing protein
MFNICDFSSINSKYGTIAGDNLLARIGQVLKEHYEAENIYRTGSDEFVVKIPTAGGSPAKDEIMDRVNIAFRELQATIRIDEETAIYPTFKVAVIKTKNNVDASVVSSMKDMTNKTGEATYGLIDFRDMT